MCMTVQNKQLARQKSPYFSTDFFFTCLEMEAMFQLSSVGDLPHFMQQHGNSYLSHKVSKLTNHSQTHMPEIFEII